MKRHFVQIIKMPESFTSGGKLKVNSGKERVFDAILSFADLLFLLIYLIVAEAITLFCLQKGGGTDL